MEGVQTEMQMEMQMQMDVHVTEDESWAEWWVKGPDMRRARTETGDSLGSVLSRDSNGDSVGK
ncbi:hypothetical protein HK101_005490 [Irineochytrium annulatum]|nr:hypothetical protein HK101_005490 [Irineochytrium annulatum]